jgi:hypothetical protein
MLAVTVVLPPRGTSTLVGVTASVMLGPDTVKVLVRTRRWYFGLQ